MTEEKITTENEVQVWLDGLNAEADEKAQELSVLLNTEIIPAVFVVTPLKDAAIAYIKTPDALQGLKIISAIGSNYENGMMLAARSQLVRTITDGEGVKQVSDERFMTEDGVYDSQNSTLNLSLILAIRKVIKILDDQFKKK